MTLRGIDGTNPLGFLAGLGLLRVLEAAGQPARLAFSTDGAFRARLSCEVTPDVLTALVAEDATRWEGAAAFGLEYDKVEKNGVKQVRDLKPPPDVFRHYAVTAQAAWCRGEREPASYAAAFGTSVAVDGKGNTKPTAFHFTAANQQFLGALEASRQRVTEPWVARSLFEGHANEPGPNLRWDPSAERNWALMAENPNADGTQVDAPLEWLAARGLALLPSFPVGDRIVTTGVTREGFTWPLWAFPAGAATVKWLLATEWEPVPAVERAERGVMALCSSAIRRTAQGFGNFAPASIKP